MQGNEKALLIDPKEVERTFLKCLYTEEEVKNIEKVPEDAIFVEGIKFRIVFHSVRIEENREKVSEWLRALPHKFRKNEGGGWSFLNACRQENGVQWTGLHEIMDFLFCLGMGLKLVESLVPRERWEVLPGGMPYYVIFLHNK